MATERPAARIEHLGPGRVRARVVRQHRSPASLERVRRQLGEQPGVDDVQVNPATGSVLVLGVDRTRIQEALSQAVELIRSVERGEPSERAVDDVVRLVRAADQRLRSVSMGRVSLRWLVPSAFLGLGLRQLLREGLSVGAVPWYVLLYYGVDSFLKLYPEHAPQRPHQSPPR